MRFEALALVCILLVCAVFARLWQIQPPPGPLPATAYELALSGMAVPGRRPPELAQLQADVSAYTRKKVEILPARELPQAAFDPERRQWNSEKVERHLVKGPNQFVFVINITDADLFTDQVPEWRYCFGARFASTAILSSHRMAGGPPDRLLKMTLRYFLEGAYGMQRTDNPQSLLYRSIMGPADIDTMQLSH